MAKYTVIHYAWESEIEVDAPSMRHAAEVAMQRLEWESAEFPCAGGETRRVTVTDSGSASKTFDVTGHTEPVYDAKEVCS